MTQLNIDHIHRIETGRKPQGAATVPTIRPRACLNPAPRKCGVIFCGEFISLPAVALRTNLSIGYLSRVFSRKKNPSLRAAELIAKALHMGLEEFLYALRGRVATRFRAIKHVGAMGLQVQSNS